MMHFTKTKAGKGSNLRVLLVEDEPADAHLVRIAFKESAIDVELERVVDGQEALEFLRKEPTFPQAFNPDLILLDLNMPRMNGKELLKALKADEKFKHFPVVVLTTSDLDRDIDECYQLGAAGFITKPIDIDQFIKMIKSLGDYWGNILRLPERNLDH